jgi:hypothetical protein
VYERYRRHIGHAPDDKRENITEILANNVGQAAVTISFSHQKGSLNVGRRNIVPDKRADDLVDSLIGLYPSQRTSPVQRR